jgi:hypothetical protein
MWVNTCIEGSNPSFSAPGRRARSWRGGRAVECGGLENRSGFTPRGGSNPSPSAQPGRFPLMWDSGLPFLRATVRLSPLESAGIRLRLSRNFRAPRRLARRSSFVEPCKCIQRKSNGLTSKMPLVLRDTPASCRRERLGPCPLGQHRGDRRRQEYPIPQFQRLRPIVMHRVSCVSESSNNVPIGIARGPGTSHSEYTAQSIINDNGPVQCLEQTEKSFLGVWADPRSGHPSVVSFAKAVQECLKRNRQRGPFARIIQTPPTAQDRRRRVQLLRPRSPASGARTCQV